MWRTALGLVALPLAERVRRLIRRGFLMAMAAALAALAFLLALAAIFALIEPELGAAAAAGILAGGVAVLSLIVAWLASRHAARKPAAVLPEAGLGLSDPAHLSAHPLQLLIAAFIAGVVAGRKL